MRTRILKDESGQVMVLTVLCMLFLFGFLALAIDVGLLFRAKRHMQIAADAASTAGALDYYKEGSNAYAKVAAQGAVGNAGLTGASFGCPAAVSGTSPGVCVRSPATTGSHTGNGYVEVEVVQPKPTTFMGLFGFSTMNVGARSVAGLTVSQSCIYVKGNLNVQGNASLCGAAVGDTITNGFCGSGNTCGTHAKAACGVYAGSITGSGGGGGSNCIDTKYVETPASSSGVNLNPSPAATNVPVQSPPAWVTNFTPTENSSCNMPPGGSWTYDSNSKVNIYTVTLSGSLSPGCRGIGNPIAGYTAGHPIDMIVNLQGTSGTPTTLSAGAYQFDLGSTTIKTGVNAGLGGTLNLGSYVCDVGSCSGSAPTSGGMTMEIFNGNFSVASTSTNDYLFAPTDTSSADGIVLWEPSSNAGTINIQWGSATSDFYGYIVALGATVSMQDQGGGAIVSGLYVGNLTLNSTLGVTNYGATVGTAPGKTIALVE